MTTSTAIISAIGIIIAAYIAWNELGGRKP